MPVTQTENGQITLNCINNVAAEEHTSLLKADVTQRNHIQEIMSVNLSKIQSGTKSSLFIYFYFFEGLRPSQIDVGDVGR